MGKGTKSPLAFAPRRLPGQSLSDQLTDSLALVPLYLLVPGFLLISAAEEWWYFFFPGTKRPNPIALTIGAVAITIYCAYKLVRIVMRGRDVYLGRTGEIAVAQYLERFRGEFDIFHDVPTQDANIDHVLIGSKGVFTIETKTMRKPARGECRVRFSEGEVFANGRKLKRNPVQQALGQASWLRQYLEERRVGAFVRPVVVFPGWYVERQAAHEQLVWVLHPKALEAFLANEPERMSREQAKAVAMGLSAYIRSKPDL